MGNLICMKKKYEKDLLEIEKIMKGDLYDEILDYVGEGLFSVVYGFDDLAIKKYTDDSCSMSELEEHMDDHIYLKELTRSKYYPTLVAYKEKEYLVTEFIEGYTLSDLYDKLIMGYDLAKLVDVENFKYYMKNIEKAISHSLSKNIVPVDVHLGNIMVKEDGNIVIVDVGNFVKRDYEISNTEKRKIKKNLLNLIYYKRECYLIDEYIKKSSKSETISY